MADKREKSLSYRRCVWLNNDPSTISLSQCIKQATDKLRTLDDRTIGRSGQLIKLLSLKPKSGGFLMHISIETPGESASIVPKIHPVPDEVNVGTASPPPNSEFMDGDAFLYIREDNVCLCSTIIRDGAIAYYLRQLFDKAKIRKDSTQFDLQKVADMDKVQLLSKLGVKEIEIKASLFEASAMYQKRKNQTVGILAAAARHAKFVFGNEHDVNEDALNVVLEMRRENVEARLVTHTYLFIAYLIGIALLFIGALLEKAPDGDVPDGVKVWIERAYLFWGIFAFLLTFGLPTALLKLQIARYDAEIERRRAESGISEHNGDRKKQKPTRPKR